MTESMSALQKIIELLTSLDADERPRVLRAAAAFFNEGAIKGVSEIDESHDSLPPRARVWMKQNSVSISDLQQVFHISGEGAEVIAPQIPGKNKKEQTYNAYVITGIAQLLLTGAASFDDKAARAVCEKSGCYDSANHSAYIRARGNEFTGSKEKGWTLTAPGLVRAAEIVKDLNKLNS